MGRNFTRPRDPRSGRQQFLAEGDRLHAAPSARPVEQIAIYNQGLPADDLRFDGETVVAFTHRPVIETVIVYEPESGTIEVIGSVKKLRERIAMVFADIKLGVSIPGERLPRRHFELTPLLDPGHLLATDPADRIRARLKEQERREKPVEIRFSVADSWARQMFIALCRRYGLRPYRYPRMRRQSVMVRAPETFLNAMLWPEFQAINAALSDYLAQVTDKVIREAVCNDTTDADEVPEPAKIGG